MKMSSIKATYLVDGKAATVEEYFAATQVEFAAVKERWSQDTDLIGRILRAHLFIEHYALEYLRAENPNLGRLEDARLSFAQKVALLSTEDRVIDEIIPGIKYLNKIRNRLAHNLRAYVTTDDAAVFLSFPLYRAMRDAANKSAPGLSNEPLPVLEHFAEYAGIALHRSKHVVQVTYPDAPTRP